MQFDDAAHHGQADAHAGVVGAVQAHEGAEQLVGAAGRKAAAVVAHLEAPVRPQLLAAQVDARALHPAGELAGVVQQPHEHLADQQRIDAQGGQCAHPHHRAGRRRMLAAHRSHQVRQRHPLQLGHGTGHLQQLGHRIDHVTQALAVLADHAHPVARLAHVAQVEPRLDQAAEHAHAAQRAGQVVRQAVGQPLEVGDGVEHAGAWAPGVRGGGGGTGHGDDFGGHCGGDLHGSTPGRRLAVSGPSATARTGSVIGPAMIQLIEMPSNLPVTNAGGRARLTGRSAGP